MLAGSRPFPEAGVVRQRGKGVDIVLAAPAVVAWKTGGRHCSLELQAAATLKVGYTVKMVVEIFHQYWWIFTVPSKPPNLMEIIHHANKCGGLFPPCLVVHCHHGWWYIPTMFGGIHVAGTMSYVHVFSCYAPKFAPSMEEKDKFSDFSNRLSRWCRGMFCDARRLQRMCGIQSKW